MAAIAKLSGEEAQRELLALYDVLPPDWWQGAKPTPEDIKGLAEEAPAEMASLASEGESGRGEVARAILLTFAANEQARPLVDRAVTQAVGPRLAPLPLIILPMLGLLAGPPLNVKSGKVPVETQIWGAA